MMLWDRRGLLGKYLTGFPVFLFVVFLLALFIAVSIALSYFKGVSLPHLYGVGFSESDFLLEEVIVKEQDGSQRAIFVEDLAIDFGRGKRGRKEVDDILRLLVNDVYACVILYKESEVSSLTGERGFRLKDGKIEQLRGNLRDYFPDVERLPLRRLRVEHEGVRDEIVYYGGVCP